MALLRARPCSRPFCPNTVRAPAVRCVKHEKEHAVKSENTGQNGVRRDQRLRRKVIARDGGMCVVCQYSEALEVHHIDGNPRNNAMTNLETRCQTCHLEAEAAIRQARKDAVLARRGRTTP